MFFNWIIRYIRSVTFGRWQYRPYTSRCPTIVFAKIEIWICLAKALLSIYVWSHACQWFYWNCCCFRLRLFIRIWIICRIWSYFYHKLICTLSTWLVCIWSCRTIIFQNKSVNFAFQNVLQIYFLFGIFWLLFLIKISTRWRRIFFHN